LKVFVVPETGEILLFQMMQGAGGGQTHKQGFVVPLLDG